jgi:Gas vesicle synthesis protein GvpL/GvpF
MKLYAYCLVEDVDALDVSIRGISDAPVSMLKIDEFGIVISEGESFPLTQSESVMAHAAVVRSLLDQTTSLPFRFGTILTEQQLRHYVATYKAALKKNLAHVRGCVEMDLKIIWQQAKTDAGQPPENEKQGPGTAFLEKKRRELLGDERQSGQKTELSNLLREHLGGLIRDEHIELHSSKTAVLAAVFHLVKKNNTEKYQEIVQEIRNNRPDLSIRLSGPWPPYSFANIELEFKSQFGVS